ncbi:MAG TPA: hypothetical protein VMV10_05350 [Pirellulales bacterium]|nr:hypothetical protein [Pirellulales bacterium]
MKAAHRTFPIGPMHFQKVVDYLSATLSDLNVPKAVANEVLSQLAPLASEIVNTP